jgi:hypothetical protein
VIVPLLVRPVRPPNVPVMVLLPVAVRPLELIVRPAKLGVADVAIPWIVFTTPPLTEKFVLSNSAMPFCVVDASSIVIAPPVPLELFNVKAPVWESRLLTEPPPPVQLAKLIAPVPSLIRQSPLLPLVVGRVRVKLVPDTPDCSVTVLPLVALLKIIEPVWLLAVPKVRLLLP